MANLATIKAELESTRPTFEQLNLTGLNFAKEVEFACQLFAANPYLAGASPESIKNAVVNVALSGLSLSPILKYASLVPRKVKNQLVCCVDPQYVGLCKILTDTGSVIGISASVVYEKEADSLDVVTGMGGHGKHKPYVGLENPGKPVACYSVAILSNGMKHVELIRPFEWEHIRERSESVKNYRAKMAKGEYCAVPIWLGPDSAEMIRKTCLKKHYKYLPKTEKAEQIAVAIDLDDQTNGIDFKGQEQAEREKHKASQSNPVMEEGVAYCTDDDIDRIMELLNNPDMPEVIFISEDRPAGFSRDKMKTALQKLFDSGVMEKVKADTNIKALEEELAKHVKKPDVDLEAAEPATETQEPVNIESKPSAIQPNETFEDFK